MVSGGDSELKGVAAAADVVVVAAAAGVALTASCEGSSEVWPEPSPLDCWPEPLFCGRDGSGTSRVMILLEAEVFPFDSLVTLTFLYAI